ncbi:YraN family protein [Desulfurobacterium pacificum]|uniref:YraN family protein n=1 Tax=Desulfurobacterium pacificum TaxID=240166 RepID=UPI0024B7A82A|nr:YraN family protein [Desulfurobacterium pacificum]
MKKGYDIIGKNFRSYWGEIDLIAYESSSKTVVFVEVKLRKKKNLVNPLESIGRKKIEKIKKTALYFLQKRFVDYEAIRFDVIGITEENGKYEIEHVEDAFQ